MDKVQATKPGGRKRATKACLRCRERKVRCDVTRTVRPCTNCRLDGLECVILPRAAVRKLSDKRASSRGSDPSPEPVWTEFPPVTTAVPEAESTEIKDPASSELPTQDEFVKEYFLHVHPILPLLHEGDFWEAYDQGFGISPLLLHAMMFVGSTETIQASGYPDTRTAKRAFYNKAKSLYDLGTEMNHVTIARAALLLTFWCPFRQQDEHRPNSNWLRIAIENAQAVGADTPETVPEAQRKPLKRLWWCCILRDRVIALCVRRSIQVPHATPFTFEDLSDEVDTSRVYDSDTKRALIDVVVLMSELSVCFTGVLNLVYPTIEPLIDEAEKLQRLRSSRKALRNWCKKAKQMQQLDSSGSVTLYTNLMWMYYHSSRIALCNYELHAFIATFTPPSENCRTELRHASNSITESLDRLLRLGLAQWLPNSAVACTALPLALYMLDVKLSPLDSATSRATQSRLNLLIQAMREYQPRYDGVDWVSRTIRYFMERTLEDTPMGQGDILITNPACYLKMALTIDLSLSLARIPDEKDFPTTLWKEKPAVDDYSRGYTLLENPAWWVGIDPSLYFALEMGLGPAMGVGQQNGENGEVMGF